MTELICAFEYGHISVKEFLEYVCKMSKNKFKLCLVYYSPEIDAFREYNNKDFGIYDISTMSQEALENFVISANFYEGIMEINGDD